MSQRREEKERENEEETFESHFPALHKEIIDGEERILEDEARTTTGSKKIRKFMGYTPGVIDFICRCSSEEEALEIIEYVLKKGDISEKHAKELIEQLQEKGLEFFGEHRAPGYYERA